MITQIHNNFFDAYSKLSTSEQKKVKDSLNSLLEEQHSKGLRFHKIQHDSNKIYSISPNMDLRIILYKNDSCTIILHVDHHDRAYRWIERKQIIEGIGCELVNSLTIQNVDSNSQSAVATIYPSPYAQTIISKLSSLDFPETLVSAFNHVSNDDELLEVIQYLSPEFQESILQALTDQISTFIYPANSNSKIVTLNSDIELEKALDYPLDKWRIFLHSEQKGIISSPINDNIVITGGPGTGKTIVLLHRALYITRKFGDENSLLLLLTYSENLVEGILRLLSKLAPEIFDQVLILTNEQFCSLSTITKDDKIFYQGRKILHILVDEAQDMDNTTTEHLNSIISSTKTKITVAYDTNQSIHRSLKSSTFEMLRNPSFREYILRYSYRTTKQISDYLSAVREKLEGLPKKNDRAERVCDSRTSHPISALSGPEVHIIKDYSLNKVVEISRMLRLRYSDAESFITNLYENKKVARTKFRYHDPKLEEVFGTLYRNIFDLKGLEYLAGIIIVETSILNFNNTERPLMDYTLSASIREDDSKILATMQKDYILKNSFTFRTYRQDSYGSSVLRAEVSWIHKMSSDEAETVDRYIKNSRGLKALFASLQEKMKFDKQPVTSIELFKHNLLYVAISRIRERVYIFAK